ncbi:polysaccharide pyruvyl transferase family protein [Methylobacterium trifolii]|uniref:Polysaccharide pyruvyl transferase domain-containing protein n=1 Tax=Methylobacterium trifolii TaxID=1003092 RepID=A0ABQ4U5Y2_9HYPH|nr:polysaccharide pyruvyl transferase family protein [Methylobacterium trifolii]GJE62696.1 hypothetical protein MPOCJGCO_4830 [Methylobacterium trifolii]
MRIAIFNVKYSANLGDGVIAECLEAALSDMPGITARSLDLAGRRTYGEGLGASRSRILDRLRTLPRPLRHLVVRVLLGGLLRLRLIPHWRRALADCDAVIVGGGQLIADADLNFPLKLSAAAAECQRRGLPVAVFAVGVTPGWSGAGRRLLRRLFSKNVVQIAVRDERSRDHLSRLLGWRSHDGLAPALCRDPGLLAAEVYPARLRTARTRPLIGIGITHPAVLRHHADAPDSLPTCDAGWYADLILAVRRTGYDVACFTNGAAEDEVHLAAVRERLRSDAPEAVGTITFAAQPRCPADLARIVAGFDALVAHRLHAHILAYAYAIPSVGLDWDGKLGAFFASVKRERFMATPGGAVGLLTAALRSGLDAGVREVVIAQTRQGILRMAEALTAECALRRSAATTLRAPRPAAARAVSAG